ALGGGILRDLRGLAEERLAGLDRETVGAEPIELGQQVGPPGRGDPEDGDEGGDADGDAEGRQGRAQTPGAQTDGADAEHVPGPEVPAPETGRRPRRRVRGAPPVTPPR